MSKARNAHTRAVGDEVREAAPKGAVMHWPLIELDHLAEIRGGATPRRDRAEFWGGDVPWLTPTDLPPLGGGVVSVEATADTITEEGLASCSASLLPPGTVLFSSRATIGKIGIAAVPLTTNQGFANLIPRPGVESRYLAWCLHFHADRIAALAGSTTFREVPKSAMKRFRIPLPPLSEQRRIVEILDQADHLRRLRAQADAKADRILPALFIKMFGDPGRSHRETARERLESLVDIGGPLVDPNRPEYLDLPHVGGEHIEKETGRLLPTPTVRKSGLRSAKFFFTERHVLYCKIRPYLNKVAYPQRKGLCSADIYPLLPKDERLGPWYLTAVLRSDDFLSYARGRSDRLRMPKLNRDQLGKYLVPVPSPELLVSFENKAASVTALDERRLASRESVTRLFNLLLHRAFRGDLTASWREAHMNELLQEMEHQAKVLGKVE